MINDDDDWTPPGWFVRLAEAVDVWQVWAVVSLVALVALGWRA